MAKQKDLFGIGKTFRVECIESGNYEDNVKSIQNGEIETTIIIGTLTYCENPINDRVFIIDDNGFINIIPIMRVVSMIPVYNSSNEDLENEEV